MGSPTIFTRTNACRRARGGGSSRSCLSWSWALLGRVWVGEATARSQFLSDRETDFPANPRVRVWVDPGWANSPPLAPVAGQLAEGCHWLLAQSRETMFLFRSLAPVLPASLPLVQVPSAAIQAMRVLPRYESCGPDAATPR